MFGQSRIIRLLPLMSCFAVFLASAALKAQSQTHSVVFNTSNVWNVPSGVSSVTVELWGGGGGGGAAGGGQGGGYVKTTFTVTANQQLHITVGQAGNGSVDKGTAGGNSQVDAGPGLIFIALGGAGAGGIYGGGYQNAANFSGASKFYFRGIQGQYGSTSHIVSVSALDKQNYIVTAVGGDGGEAGGATNTKGFGGAAICLLNPPASTYQPYNCSPLPDWGTVTNAGPLATTATPGVEPGGGGGGGSVLNVLTGCKISGASGGPGLVILTY
jgi:hypothetical protein